MGQISWLNTSVILYPVGGIKCIPDQTVYSIGYLAYLGSDSGRFSFAGSGSRLATYTINIKKGLQRKF